MLAKVLLNFASQCLGLLVSIGDRVLLVALLLRLWQPEMFADWTTLLSITALLGLADLGFVVFVGNRLQKLFLGGDEEGFRRFVGTSVFIYGVLAFLMVVGASGFAYLLQRSPFLTIHALNLQEAAAALFLLGIAQALHTAKSAISQIYRGRGNFARGGVVDALSMTCVVSSAILATFFEPDVVQLAVVYVAAQIVFGWGILVVDLRKRYPELSLLPLLPRWLELRNFVLAMRWYALSYALPTIWLQAPVLLLNGLGIGGVAVVAFVVQRTLVSFCRTFSVMLSMAAGVELVVHVHANDTVRIEKGVQAVGRVVAGLAGAMMAGLLGFGSALVLLWTGKPFLFDSTVVFLLAVPAILVAPAIPLLYLAHLSDMPKPQVAAQIVQIGVAIVLCWLLAPTWGLAGVAFALAFGEVLGIGIVLPLLLNRRLRLAYWRHATICLLVAMGALAWSGTISVVVFAVLRTDTPGAALVGLVLWSLVTFGPILFFLLPRDQFMRLIKR
jgi:O-antigen/teichoic acid export membrane protein